ncbi:UNVERIFIED_CONTAM: RING-H2 finger protein ATL13 [Sesamum latifolium]|uniref:RING-type E3 ubiquitin transferase n=1 Tax=Sesamum latifolium TaxID=2727402 RepID=A0AAW2XJ32_9LAMI
MGWVAVEIKERSFVSSPPSEQPYFLLLPPPPPLSQSSGFNLNSKVSPSILLIIIILAIIFFISGLLHLLVRFLLRPPNRDPDEMDNVTALQGQLQQLFHLHDSGVDQSFIDTLPVFNYKAIIGVKDPFDCAVCLCEFEAEDKLRLLPKCSHAFHMDCIDTWLLSHSTCPLCRASLLTDFSPNTNCSPIVLVLESGSESSREIVADRDVGLFGTTTASSVARVNSHLSEDFRLPHADPVQKSGEIQAKDEENQSHCGLWGESCGSEAWEV